MFRSRITVWGLGALAALAACDGGAPDAQPDGAALFSCEAETRAVAYAPGLTRASSSGAWQVVLVSSDPGPPIKGTNTWTVRVLDGAGATRDDVTVTVRTLMPDHNHGSTVKAVVTPMGGGLYRVTPLYLYMAGLWQVTLAIDAPTGPDNVMFPICIPG